TLASWYFTLAGPVSRAGFRVIAYDLRGHGRTERPAQGYRLADFVDDLAGLLDKLGETAPVCLFGNSFGGTIAFAYAVRYPHRVRAVVAVESAPPTAAWMERALRRLDRASSQLPSRRPVQRRGWTMRGPAQLLKETTLAADLARSRLPSQQQIEAIHQPVLGIYGAASGMAGFASTLDRLPAATTAVIAGGRHTVLLDQPSAVHRHIAAWLDRHHLAGPARPASTDRTEPAGRP
ncbi:MAG: alpha/beta fold hydrolase, partial [Micromonosporaceae bacterium]|nr:alpha/beta fold hydrolase [Micromonosporaceae bacterium]